MQDSKLRTVTLFSWTMEIWSDHRRGLPLFGQMAAIAYCLEHHKEWWSDWDSARDASDDPSITTRLMHIHTDAAVKAQLDRGEPSEINALYSTMQEKGFTEFEIIHTVALAFTEENARVRETGDNFNQARYIEKAGQYVKEALARPNLTRMAKSKTY